VVFRQLYTLDNRRLKIRRQANQKPRVCMPQVPDAPVAAN
jgi:hypothetical protein